MEIPILHLPDARPTIARGDNHRDVINHGHLYVFAAKLGTRRVQTSGWEPWRDYTVEGWWIDELWTSHKLDHSVYLEYAAKVRVGFVGRQRQAQALQEQERATALRFQQLSGWAAGLAWSTRGLALRRGNLHTQQRH